MEHHRHSATMLTATLVLFTSCAPTGSSSSSVNHVRVDRLESLQISPTTSWQTLRWPAFLLAEPGDRFLWGEGNVVYEIEQHVSGLEVSSSPVSRFDTSLAELIGGAKAEDGTLFVLDAEGQVASPGTGPRRGRSFDTFLKPRVKKFAVAEGHAYFLLSDELEGGGAVAGYTVDGRQAGTWGEMPTDGLIQNKLSGGGIAACPDGSIYFSYINSPEIFVLDPRPGGETRPVGRIGSAFEVLSRRSIRKARRETTRSRTVTPLVKLGLSGSRVMSLLCSAEGLLLRQVAHSGKEMSEVEVWDPAANGMIGTIQGVAGVLLSVRDQTLYLGRRSEAGVFTLERIRYHVTRTQAAQAAI